MSLEDAILANTAELKRVGDLLEQSNADRAKLLASASSGAVAASTTAAPAADDGLSVADIKEAVKTATPEELQKMLADEKGGKNRQTAVKAIEDVMKANGTAATEAAEQQEEAKQPEPAPKASETSGQASTGAADKNAQPVPASVTVEQAQQAFGNWFSETDDETERAARREFVAKIVEALGARIGELDDQGRRKAIFFLRRKRAGIEIDFSAAYDFEGSPTQDAPAAASTAAAADDDLL